MQIARISDRGQWFSYALIVAASEVIVGNCLFAVLCLMNFLPTYSNPAPAFQIRLKTFRHSIPLAGGPATLWLLTLASPLVRAK
jgi:hypothetical protein